MSLKATPSCGQRMPIGSSLSEQEITCLEAWVGSL
jgi:hypothetical protein